MNAEGCGRACQSLYIYKHRGVEQTWKMNDAESLPCKLEHIAMGVMPLVQIRNVWKHMLAYNAMCRFVFCSAAAHSTQKPALSVASPSETVPHAVLLQMLTVKIFNWKALTELRWESLT